MAMIASPATHAFLRSPQKSFGSEGTAGDIGEDVWGELRRVLVDVGTTLSAEDELDNLAAAEAAVIARDTERASIVSKLEAEYRQLQKQHSAAASSALRPSTVPSPSEHNDQMRHLEGQHYSTVKALTEEQATLGKKEVELGRCKSEREEVGGWKVGEEEGYESDVLRLKLLNDIGFRLLPRTDNAPVKVLIRNDAKEDVHTTTLDKTRSKAQWANLVWNLASE
ncbi:uncharacterized protein MKK02DRAFT_38986 [Dioszegia hungarica]|uniref:Kinetochore protein Spc24 n=1 Tax=Dioszegia hungarica TaxID=4972 RepID=A0AA38H5C3_9TREE|nr:uncharacterized protein MKK02DRAFT_38986 [Dioszegia hungarica]KAI9634310.1 hypothetical protein MKK02DRAFT_38986 [Dioszegia hungarica]